MNKKRLPIRTTSYMAAVLALLLIAFPSLFAHKTTPSFGKVPIYFIANNGQVNQEVRYYTGPSPHGSPGFTLWITDTELVCRRKIGENKPEITRLSFIGASAEKELLPLDKTTHRVNYFKSRSRTPAKSNPGRKREPLPGTDSFAGIATYEAVIFKNIYRQIDLKIYGKGNTIEYDWIIRPGGNPDDIRFQYHGVRETGLTPGGDLYVGKGPGNILHGKPFAFQEKTAASPKRLLNPAADIISGTDGFKPNEQKNTNTITEVESRFEALPGSHTYGFKVNGYDRSLPLVIDPLILSFSTYLGVNAESSPAAGVCADSSGYVYVTGIVLGAEFPVKSAFQETPGGEYDIYVTRFSPYGDSLMYSTFIGGTGDDYSGGIAVDSQGCAYITGYTYSEDFPTHNALYGTLKGNVDAVVVKLSANGAGLKFSTYLGGTSSDRGRDIAVSGDYVYIAGDTRSGDFPLLLPLQGNPGSFMDAFLTRLTSTGSALVFSTYLGGNGLTRAGGMAVDTAGNVYMTGSTSAGNFPVKNACQSSPGGGSDAFVGKFSPSGTLEYSTFLGGADNDDGKGVAVDAGGAAVVTGNTYSANFPTQNPYQRTLSGSRDAFVARIAAGGGSLIYSTYLGGNSEGDIASAITVNYAGNAYVTGNTNSENFPSVDPLQTGLAGGTDVFICRFTPDGGALDFSTFFGGTGNDFPAAIALFGRKIFITGYTGSRNFPTLNPYQGTYTGSSNLFGNAAFVAAMDYFKPLPAAPPFGNFETPLEGASYAGSIAITGWALDNAEIPAIKIYIGPENGQGLTYIGDALFVEGARPDIMQAFSDYPYSSQGGWGYMMLSHFLPGGGDGPYTLHAIATDSDGNSVSLGARTITCNNAAAVKPFGAIDTPLPGGTVSGDYRNVGWTLTPNPNTIPKDGSTIDVYVDGITIGHPEYNVYRPDIAGFFPGLLNSGGSQAHLRFDTSKYANGLHTIAWLVTNDAGNAEGIGSRYFTIYNTPASPEDAAEKHVFTHPASPFTHIPHKKRTDFSDLYGNLETIPTDTSFIRYQSEPGEHFRAAIPDENGVTRIFMKELQRLEIQPGQQVAPEGLSACMLIENRPTPLPVGSSFQPDTGTFYWQPGPGFIGTYHLLFLQADNKGNRIKKQVAVTIGPR
ncbi:MAG: hypothetical protein GY765_39430 [bacterium]|nr:hypothetical protein [bacterium]